MKKYFSIIFLCLYATSLPAQSTSCANGDGIEIKGINGTVYCLSRIDMNWWSAHAWCDTLSKKLIDTNIDCKCNNFTDCDTSLPCPNIYSTEIRGKFLWTANTFTEANSYAINGTNLTIDKKNKKDLGYALCE